MDIKIPYYEDNTRVSNSAIGWFLKKGPLYFHKKLSGEIPDEKSSAMDKGTMIHMYLLQPEEFKNTYEVYTGIIPKSDNQKKFCEELVHTLELEPNKALISAYKASYKVTTQNDDLILSKAKEMASTLNSYINMLKNKSNKIQIRHYEMEMLNVIGNNVKKHKLADKLLNPKKGENHHEFHINWENKVPCKSLIDCCTFDKENKRCILVDITTTVHIGCFEESMTQYDYLRQLAFYKMALMWYIDNELKEDSSKWDFEYYIIAIDTINTYEVRVFTFIPKQIKDKCNFINNILDELKFHYDHNLWDHTRTYYEGTGAEPLILPND